jgi:cardiolipin synthase A/B
MNKLTAGNRITLLRNGAEYFPAVLAAIRQASREIYLQSYIFEADAIGLAVADALKQAAKRGVMVKVLLDGFGSKSLPKSFVRELESCGVEVMFYRPKISPWTLKKNRLRRLHRKIIVVDNRIGFLGGINIIDDYNVPDEAPPRIDYAVKLEGPLVQALCKLSKTLWRKLSWLHFRQAMLQLDCEASPALNGGIPAALVIRDNVLHRRDIETAYLAAIHQATTHILIANAYFLPNKSFRDALIKASQRGVKVTLLLQGRVEYFYMIATRALYHLFLKPWHCNLRISQELYA